MRNHRLIELGRGCRMTIEEFEKIVRDTFDKERWSEEESEKEKV